MREAMRMMAFAGMVVSALMIVVWLFRIKSKGATAYLMASAFAVFGGLCWTMSNEGPAWLMWTLGVALFLLLAADFAVRSERKE